MQYHSSSGPNFTVCDDAATWVISSGAGIIIVTNAIKRSALAFCCATRGTTYAPVVERINAKLPRQLKFHEDNSFIFRDEKKS